MMSKFYVYFIWPNFIGFSMFSYVLLYMDFDVK
jgi:hypothetical protein